MGRTLFLEERLQAYIDSLYSSGNWTLGLIVGQVCNHNSHIVFNQSLSLGPVGWMGIISAVDKRFIMRSGNPT